MTDKKDWLRLTEQDVKRLKEKKPATLFGILFYGGTLGIVFVVPVIGGAYLGRWIDTLYEGYSVRWTTSLIILGVALAIYNVFWFLRGKL